MPEVEIQNLPPLQPHEQSQLVMHSFLNVLNVLVCELTLIGIEVAKDDQLFDRSLTLCRSLRRSLADAEAGLNAARELETHIATILGEIDERLAVYPEKRASADFAEQMENIRSVFAILRVRARELLARAEHPDRWEDFSIAELQRNFHDVFAAIERNSRHRYRILYNAARQEAQDYYLDFKLESHTGDRLQMPSVFQDVLRDLVANARKYTAPGGHITAAVYADAQELRLVVEDTGRGIPPEELTKVVEFGRRASNVGDVRTMGGGFGLTKAFFATKQFGGRFWIASERGVGTRVRLTVPRPAASVQAA